MPLTVKGEEGWPTGLVLVPRIGAEQVASGLGPTRV